MTESGSVGESHTCVLADLDLSLPNYPTLIDQLYDAKYTCQVRQLSSDKRKIRI